MDKKNDIEIRKKIVDVATEMFMSEGCKTVKMDTIAERLGMSKRTLYEIFNDKEELLSLCVEKVVISLKEFEKTIVSDENPESFVGWIRNISTHHDNMMFEAGPKFVAEVHKYYPAIFEKYFINYEEDRVDVLRKVIAISVKKGYLRHDVDPNMVVMFINNMLKQIYFDRISLSPQYTKKDIFVHFFKTYFRGISSEKLLAEVEHEKNEIKDMFKQNPKIKK